MSITSILSMILDPKVLAAAGAWAGYRYLGKGKSGYQPYAYAAGAAAAGYGIGRVVKDMLDRANAAQALPQASAVASVTMPPTQSQNSGLIAAKASGVSDYAPYPDRGRAMDRGVEVEVEGLAGGYGDSGYGSDDLDEAFKD